MNSRPRKKSSSASYHQSAPAKSQVVDGQIVAMNEYGDGEIHSYRRVIKVARCVVGDQVRVRVPLQDRRYVYGQLLKVLISSQKRVESGCASFEAGCGGCQWLHFDYSQQLLWKERILREMLKQRCGIGIRIREIIPMTVPRDYRNKLSLRNARGSFVNMQEFGDIDIAATRCQVETPANQEARALLMALRPPPELLQVHVRSNEKAEVGLVIIASRLTAAIRTFAQTVAQNMPGISGVGVQIKDRFECLWGIEHLCYVHDSINYKIPLNGFFQTNYSQARALTALVLKQLALARTDHVLDLYCGCGFFSLPMAKRAGMCLGIENNGASTATALANAKDNNIDNVDFLKSDVGTALEGMKVGQWQIVLLDPPRAGCDALVLQELLRLRPRRLVYVSCSPAALCRDLKYLLAGSYQLLFCQPIDMFPHTAHMETVVTLVCSPRS